MNTTPTFKLVYPRQYSGETYGYTVQAPAALIMSRVIEDLRCAHASAVETNHIEDREIIVENGAEGPFPELCHVVIELNVADGDTPWTMSEQAQLNDVVRTWATRSRVSGIRGDRFHAVTDLASTTTFGSCLTLRAEAILGTMIFYNDRRATAGWHAEAWHVAADLDNLVQYASEVRADIGIKVTHDQHGEFLHGL